jgi:hypothetical protein
MKIRGINRLNLRKQRFICISAAGTNVRSHRKHGKNTASFQQISRFRESDFLWNPLKRRRRIQQIIRPAGKIICLKVSIYDTKMGV